MKEKSWACTLITQLSLCVAAYIAMNIGQPQKFTPRYISNEGSRQNDLHFVSVVGGFRPLEEQTLLLQQMVKAVKSYRVHFVLDFSELGGSDPLLHNATLFPELRNLPWYSLGALKGEGQTYFSKKIVVPDGQALDLIALDTVLLQDQSSERGNDHIVWLTRTLNESNSDWKVVVGLHQSISCSFNILKSDETIFKTLRNTLLQYGVDVYMSLKTCNDDNTTQKPEDKAVYLTSMNTDSVSKEETSSGFLLHRVSSFEMVTLAVKMSGEIEQRLSFQQRVGSPQFTVAFHLLLHGISHGSGKTLVIRRLPLCPSSSVGLVPSDALPLPDWFPSVALPSSRFSFIPTPVVLSLYSAMATSAVDSLPITTMINMVPIKLEQSTYLMWHRQIIHMAECFDLMGFLDGSVVAPSPTLTSATGEQAPNPAYTAWRQKDKKLLSVLFTSLSADAASEVLECSTSHAAWSALQAAFADTSDSHTHQLREELLSLRRGDLSVEVYGRKFKNLCDQLSAIGRPIDESDKSHWFLRGLGIQFSNFADTRMALAKLPSFRDLLHQARQFEAMLRAMEGSSLTPAAFAASHTGGGRGNNSHIAGGRGSTHGGRTHHNHHEGDSNNGGSGRSGGVHSSPQQGYRHQSGFRGQSGKGQSSTNASGGRRPYVPRCQICRGEHYADKCPRFITAQNAMSSAHLAEAFNSSCTVSDPVSDWYMDSGASAHMTNQTTALDSYEPYTESGHKGNSGTGKM